MNWSLLLELLRAGIRIEIRLLDSDDDEPPLEPPTQTVYTVVCDECGWVASHPTQDAAQRALRTHQSRHCTATGGVPEWLTNQAD